MDVLKPLPCKLETKVLEQPDFADLYKPEWSNALCEDRKHLDVLGVGAYDNGKLVGLAACSADGDTMWQIGIDVLPGYRRQGIASEMIAFIKAYTKEQGINRMELNMWEFNEDALAFYEAVGFKTYRRYMEMMLKI